MIEGSGWFRGTLKWPRQDSTDDSFSATQVLVAKRRSGRNWLLRAVLNRFSRFCSHANSVLPLHRTRRCAVAADQIAHVKSGDHTVRDHPFAADHHPIGTMRAAQDERSQRVAIAGKA